MNRTIQIIIGAVVLVVVAGSSFYGGVLYGSSQNQSATTSGSPSAAGALGTPSGVGGRGQFNPGQGQFGGAGGGGVFGQIVEVDKGTLVVADMNGKQTRVQVTDTTLIEKTTSVSLSELAVGEAVSVSGTVGGDGTITARSVIVAPAGRIGVPANRTGR